MNFLRTSAALVIALCFWIPAPADAAATTRKGLSYYISPSGSDANDGRSEKRPWKTFDRVFNADKLLKPGDTLILLDGVYELGTTGLPRIDARNANDGEAAAPITIRAQHERRAWLRSDGSRDSFSMSELTHWRVEGLYATNADRKGNSFGAPFSFSHCSHLVVRRCLGAYDNRYSNRHIFEFLWGSSSLFEECEAYYFHRHGFSIWQSRNVTIRRCYANSRGRRDLTGGYASHFDEGGDEGVVFYGSSDCLAENCILENRSEGFDVHGGTTFDGQPGGRGNRFLGCISIGGIFGGNVGSNPQARVAEDNLFRDLIVIAPLKVGLYLRSMRAIRVENATISEAAKATAWQPMKAPSPAAASDAASQPRTCSSPTSVSACPRSRCRTFGSSTPASPVTAFATTRGPNRTMMPRGTRARTPPFARPTSASRTASASSTFRPTRT